MAIAIDSSYIRYVPRVKFLTSTKAKLLEETVNLEILELEKQGYEIESVVSNISYTGEKGSMAYMILCQITYTKKVVYKIDSEDNSSRNEQASL